MYPKLGYLGSVSQSPVVLIATDLTEASEPALVRGATHAAATGARVVVCHVVPDVFHTHPLNPARSEQAISLSTDLVKRAADMVTEQARRVAGLSPDEDTVVISVGVAEDEIVRIAAERGASLIVIGAKPRTGMSRVFGRTAERVIRYAECAVLVARPSGKGNGRILVATDFSDAALPALAFAQTIVKDVAVDATLLHVMQPPSTLLPSIASPLGSPVVPPASATVDQLEELGRQTLAGFAKQYGMAHAEQVEGDPAETILERAKTLDAEMIIMGSRGRTGLARLFLGSTAEHVVREAACSVLVAR